MTRVAPETPRFISSGGTGGTHGRWGGALKNLELQSSSFRNFASHARAHSLDVRTNMVLVALVAEKEVETWMQRRRKTFGRRGGFDAG